MLNGYFFSRHDYHLCSSPFVTILQGEFCPHLWNSTVCSLYFILVAYAHMYMWCPGTCVHPHTDFQSNQRSGGLKGFYMVGEFHSKFRSQQVHADFHLLTSASPSPLHTNQPAQPSRKQTRSDGGLAGHATYSSSSWTPFPHYTGSRKSLQSSNCLRYETSSPVI